MVEFLKAHPELVAVVWVSVLWPLLSGLATWALDKHMPRTDAEWSELFAHDPKLAAVYSFLKTAGLNLPGLGRSIRAFFAGPPPELPAYRSKR